MPGSQSQGQDLSYSQSTQITKNDVLPEIISSGTSLLGQSSISSSTPVTYGNDLSQVDKDLIFEGLKKLYKKKVLPLELSSKYSHFGSPPLSPSDFEAKPMVLILGQVRWRLTVNLEILLNRFYCIIVFCW